MDYDRIKYTAVLIYEQCNITELPFDCFQLLAQKGFTCKKYSQLSESKYQACMELSQDSCTIGDTIYYNDKRSPRRIRFSLMHELGHIELNTDNETEANLFSSNILCPSIALHFSRLTNIREIANLFNISLECAKYAKEFYERWLYSVKTYGMTDIDRKMYQYFYNPDRKQFIFKETQCIYCDTIIYNSNKPICHKCDKPLLNEKNIYDTQAEDLFVAENQWLYRGL
ncbi:MAG TPA: ImmA/IrrE family metallo-endopeptidase [Clostridiales bacterium]|nr:ImmA/IrrE family metallo-endopeptidase [Clostridiales bacterium]